MISHRFGRFTKGEFFMNAGNELNYYLNELRNSNLLNSNRAISDVLRCSADIPELIAYIAFHAKSVSLKDQLCSFSSRHSLPSDPRISLPFAYTLLHLMDTGKFSAEDLVCSVFPHMDAFDAYPLFVTAIANAIESSVPLADSQQPVLGDDIEEETPSDPFDEFSAFVAENAPDDYKNTLAELSDNLRSYIEQNDVPLAKSIYFGLVGILPKAGLDLSALNNIKNEMNSKGFGV